MLLSLLILANISFGVFYPIYSRLILRKNNLFLVDIIIALVSASVSLFLFIVLYRDLPKTVLILALAWIIASLVMVYFHTKEKLINSFSLIALSLSGLLVYMSVHYFLLGSDLLLLLAGYATGIVASIVFGSIVVLVSNKAR